MKFRTFFLQRLLAWALTIWIGVTFIFFIPRMFPSDPVENMIAQMQSRSGNMDPAEMEALRSQLRVQFGLEGSLLQQYGSFLWNGLFHFDFGPSLMSYPEPVTSIIGRNLPYTLGLSLTSTLLGWVIGNFIGLLAGFRKNARSSKIMESIAICIYPIPYFLIALILQIFFAYVLGWFHLHHPADPRHLLAVAGIFAARFDPARVELAAGGHRLADHLHEVPGADHLRGGLRQLRPVPWRF